MSIRISKAVQEMSLSKTIEVLNLTKELEREGKVVYSLCVGEPDYQPPAEVVRATGEAAANGNTKYTAVNGEAKLRSEIAKDLSTRKGLPYTAEGLVVANGAKQSVVQAIMAIANPGDEIIVPAPYWTSYPEIVKLCGAEPLILNTVVEHNYQPTGASLRSLLEAHPRVVGIILCNPSNPTGHVASREQLVELAAVLRDFPQVTVVSDEIYERLTYEGEHVSFAALDGMFDRTITINGFSKSHSMTGYRIGYSASPVHVAKAISKIQSQLTSSPSSISQAAALVALTEVNMDGPDGWMTQRIHELKEKRDFAYSLLCLIQNIDCPKPTGAFYLLPRVDYYFGKTYRRPNGTEAKIHDSYDLCMEFLRGENVALVAGDAFGAPECVRLSYAASKETIEQSLVRLGKFLHSLY